jgi:hypothetical protein
VFTLRFDTKKKHAIDEAVAAKALLPAGLEAASMYAVAVAKEMEALVSDEHAKISLFRCVRSVAVATVYPPHTLPPLNHQLYDGGSQRGSA